MFPDTGGVYSNYNFGALFQQLAGLGTQLANGLSGVPSSYNPTLYPFAAYNGYGPNPFNPAFNPSYSPFGNLSNYPYGPGTNALFDTYNSGPFSGSSALVILALVIGAIVLIKVV